MPNIPTIAFAGWSGTGKTTLIEKLVAYWKSQGLRIAVVKHDAHDFEIDKEGKDSWRFAQSGADMTLISSATKTAVVEYRPCTFHETLSFIHDVDLILVEGYKQEDIPRVGISRKATGNGLTAPAEAFIAIVTDDEMTAENAPVPCFSLEDVEGLAAFLLHTLSL